MKKVSEYFVTNSVQELLDMPLYALLIFIYRQYNLTHVTTDIRECFACKGTEKRYTFSQFKAKRMTTKIFNIAYVTVTSTSNI
jgi:hypothetical protein